MKIVGFNVPPKPKKDEADTASVEGQSEREKIPTEVFASIGKERPGKEPGYNEDAGWALPNAGCVVDGVSSLEDSMNFAQTLAEYFKQNIQNPKTLLQILNDFGTSSLVVEKLDPKSEYGACGTVFRVSPENTKQLEYITFGDTSLFVVDDDGDVQEVKDDRKKDSNRQVNIFPEDGGYQSKDGVKGKLFGQDYGFYDVERAKFAIAMSDGLTDNLSREELLKKLSDLAKTEDPNAALEEILAAARANMNKPEGAPKGAHPDDVSVSFVSFKSPMREDSVSAQAEEIPRLMRGQLKDGATWEQNSSGKIIITRKQSIGLKGDTFREVEYTPTIPELNEISKQQNEVPTVSASSTIEVEPTPQERYEKRKAEVAEMLRGQDFTKEPWAVDPFAEADIYMMYGRTEQAIEILEDAVRIFKEGAVSSVVPGDREEPPVGSGPETDSIERVAEMTEPLPAVFTKNPRGARAIDRATQGLREEHTESLESHMQPEATPKEWRERLGNLIMRATEGIGSVGKAQEYLGGRGRELLAEAKKSGIEGLFTKMGEKYNKLSTREKIFLGGTLAFGLSLTSSWIAALYGGALVTARVAALAGTYINNRKSLEEVNKGESKGGWIDSRLNKWLGNTEGTNKIKNAAMAKSLLISFGLIGGAGALNQLHVGERVGSWIGEHLYNWNHSDAKALGQMEFKAPARTPVFATAEIQGLPDADIASNRAALEKAWSDYYPDKPFPGNKEASEGILKRMIADDTKSVSTGPQEAPNAEAPAAAAPAGASAEQLRQERDALQAEVDKKMAALAEAKTKVAELKETAAAASAPSDALEIKPVGASARGYEGMVQEIYKQLPDERPEGIEPKSDLDELYKAKESGNPRKIADAIHEIAKKHGFFTSEGSKIISTDATMSVNPQTGNILFNNEEQAAATMPVQSEYNPAAALNTPPQTTPLDAIEMRERGFSDVRPEDFSTLESSESLPSETMSATEPIATVDITQGQVDQKIRIPGQEKIMIPPEPPPSAFIEHTKEFVNPNGVKINPLEGHVYQDSSGAALAYGNDFDSRFNAAQAVAKANQNMSVWVQAERPTFYEGAWRPWVQEVRYVGFWGGFKIDDHPLDASHIGAIKPDTFIRRLDK